MDRSLKKQIFCHKMHLKEQKNDFAYWQTQSYQARLEALEEIRQNYHKWKDNNAESRLQRVYTILNDCNKFNNLRLKPAVN